MDQLSERRLSSRANEIIDVIVQRGWRDAPIKKGGKTTFTGAPITSSLTYHHIFLNSTIHFKLRHVSLCPPKFTYLVGPL